MIIIFLLLLYFVITTSFDTIIIIVVLLVANLKEEEDRARYLWELFALSQKLIQISLIGMIQISFSIENFRLLSLCFIVVCT